MEYIVILSFLLVAVSGRVTDSPSQFTLNELLSKADPLDNEVFFEPVIYNTDTVRDFPSSDNEDKLIHFFPSPAQHILESFSQPKYVDASEFRTNDETKNLPPFLDINRHLTLIKASHRFSPPEDSVVEEVDVVEPKVLIHEFLPHPASLFREHTSSNLREQLLNQEEQKYEIANESDIAVAETEAATEGTTEKIELPKSAFSKREPIVYSLSPLSHILDGFKSEFGAFGGDSSRDRFISAFRPDDF